MIPRLIPVLAMMATCAFGQAPPIKTRLVTLALDQQIENAYFMNNGEVHPFTADRTGLGDPFPYTGPAQFILRAKAEDFAAKPPMPPPLASVALPPRSKLVLLVGARKDDQKINLNAYDISTEGFRPGDYRVFNFSDKVVSLIFGDIKFTLRSGQDKTVTKAILRDKVLDVGVQIAEVENGVSRRVYASAWGHQPVKRNFVFLFNGSHPTRPIAIRRFADYGD